MKFKMSMFSKMILLSGLIEIIMMIIVVFALYSIRLNDRKQVFGSLENILSDCSNLRLQLLVRRDSSFTNLFTANNDQIAKHLRTFDSLIYLVRDTRNIDSLIKKKNHYKKMLESYSHLVQKIGLNENIGIEGNFRDIVHQIESYLKVTNDNNIYLLMLQARRREKDFIMRNRFEYVSQVSQIIEDLKQEVTVSKIPKYQKYELKKLAIQYLDSFLEFVHISNQITIQQEKMNFAEKSLQMQISKIMDKETIKASKYQGSIVPLFILSILSSFILSIIIARSITKPLVSLKHATIKIANGDLKIKVKIESEDEIGDLANFFNLMTENIAIANETILNQQFTLNSQYSELKEINATRDKFFSIIAHDLKNPISSFMGVSSFLTKTFQDLSREEIKEFLDEVSSSAKALHELLENLLLWSRSQRGLVNYHPISLDLRLIILSNLELLKMNAENKLIRLCYHMETECQVYADPNMINTVLRNLITNAIKFTHSNGEVRVEAKNINKFCQITVADNGVGIANDKIDSLFKLEGSVSTVGTHHESGTGLGLILCKEFVEKHGGEIWVESTIGEGSKFHFTLPFVDYD